MIGDFETLENNQPKFTQRTLQLTKKGKSIVIWLALLNRLYAYISAFEKALAKFNKRFK